MTTTPPPWPTCTPGWCRIDPGLGAAATRVPAASREDYRPQAILKLQPRNSFDYRVRYEPQLNNIYPILDKNYYEAYSEYCFLKLPWIIQIQLQYSNFSAWIKLHFNTSSNFPAVDNCVKVLEFFTLVKRATRWTAIDLQRNIFHDNNHYGAVVYQKSYDPSHPKDVKIQKILLSLH